MEFNGLRRIISGGQVGADLGGLTAAHNYGVETGGWAPRGWRTEFGANPKLGTKFGLIEHFSPNYKVRTEKNVEESDGTLIIASSLTSPGTALTICACTRMKKPFFTVMLPFSTDLLDDLSAFIISNGIQVLNVAGNRDRDFAQQKHHNAALDIVTQLIVDLDSREKLVKNQA